MRLGILARELGSSALAYHILKESATALSQYSNLDIVVFYESLAKPWATPLFPVMNIGEAFGFDGVVVATDLKTAAKMKSFPGPKAQFFYVWDLEWVGGSAPYEEEAAVYCDRSTPIIARSHHHKESIERCWNRPVLGVVENFNIAELCKVIEQYDTEELGLL